MKMSTKEVAEEMGVSTQFLRDMAQKGKLPFAIVIKGETNHSYYFDRERFRLFKEGKL